MVACTASEEVSLYELRRHPRLAHADTAVTKRKKAGTRVRIPHPNIAGATDIPVVKPHSRSSTAAAVSAP
jgi:hypothetical protein